jgi:hypothetical protein
MRGHLVAGLFDHFNCSWVTLLRTNRFCKPVSAPRWCERFFYGSPRVIGLFTLAAFCLLASQPARSQDAAASVATKKPAKQPVESEFIVEGGGSFGHYRIFASSDSSKLYESGVEYDRHSWGKFIGARMDYVAEVLPVVFLFQPVKADVWGDQLAPPKERVPGVGFSPIGFRMMWRSNKLIKPYFIAKGGVLIFDKKALSPDAAYVNLSFQLCIGIQARLTRKLDLRAGYADIHFSNAFVVPSNPGLDVMSYNSGLSYHFGK